MFLILEMKQSVRVGSKIYPDFEQFSMSDLNEYLKPIALKEFLFDNGIALEYDTEEVEPRNYPGDLSFWDQGRVVLTVTISFGRVIIEKPETKEEKFCIPILESFKINL